MSDLDARALKAQLEAVRGERDAALARLNLVRDERDQLLGKLAEAERIEMQHIEQIKAHWRWVLKLEARALKAQLEAVRGERDAALARLDAVRPVIDPLFFSQECSDARICLRTGPVCMCGIEKMQERVKKLEAVAEAARRPEDWDKLHWALAALDAPAAHDGDGDAD